MSSPRTHGIDSGSTKLRRGVRQDAGPIVWAAILGVTCLLIFLFQKMLWLVVPMLLGLILYYLLVTPLQFLILHGQTREASAGWIMSGFMVLVIGIGLAATPWISHEIGNWQFVLTRYFHGGMEWVADSLRRIEASWPLLRQAGLSDHFAERLSSQSNDLVGNLEVLVTGIAVWTPSLILCPFLAFFFLRDGLTFKRFLSRAVPNAFFERSLALMHDIDQTLRAYFVGLINLTILDAISLGLGLWLLGFPGPWLLGLMCAIFAWVPYVGSILGGILVVLVAATDFPADATMAYWAIGLFLLVRMLDDFLYMPLTIGKSLHMHPLITVVMIFVGGAIAGISGLMLVLPLLGVVMVVGEAIGQIVTDDRLMARHRHGLALRRRAASEGLI